MCDHPIDERHQGILPARIWGDGEPEGVRQRAAEEIKDTARAAAKLGVDTVIGFTGSSIWHTVAMFPPVPPSMIERGYQDFADRWNPILDVFDEVGVRFAHEVHPSEIAYDYWTTVRTLEAIGHRPAFGLNFDPSHFVWQDLDPVGFLWDFEDRIYHVDCKESVEAAQRAERAARLAPAVGRPAARLGLRLHRSRRCPVGADLPDAQPIGYAGPISVEWEDAGMDRCSARPTRSRSSAAGSRSSRPPRPSTPPSAPRPDPRPAKPGSPPAPVRQGAGRRGLRACGVGRGPPPRTGACPPGGRPWPCRRRAGDRLHGLAGGACGRPGSARSGVRCHPESGTGAGRSQRLATGSDLPSCAASSSVSITSRTCSATSADARCGRPSATAPARSASPEPRPAPR